MIDHFETIMSIEAKVEKEKAAKEQRNSKAKMGRGRSGR